MPQDGDACQAAANSERNEPSGSINGGEFVDEQGDWYFLQKDFFFSHGIKLPSVYLYDNRISGSHVASVSFRENNQVVSPWVVRKLCVCDTAGTIIISKIA